VEGAVMLCIHIHTCQVHRFVECAVMLCMHIYIYLLGARVRGRRCDAIRAQGTLQGGVGVLHHVQQSRKNYGHRAKIWRQVNILKSQLTFNKVNRACVYQIFATAPKILFLIAPKKIWAKVSSSLNLPHQMTT